MTIFIKIAPFAKFAMLGHFSVNKKMIFLIIFHRNQPSARPSKSALQTARISGGACSSAAVESWCAKRCSSSSGAKSVTTDAAAAADEETKGAEFDVLQAPVNMVKFVVVPPSEKSKVGQRECQVDLKALDGGYKEWYERHWLPRVLGREDLLTDDANVFADEEAGSGKSHAKFRLLSSGGSPPVLCCPEDVQPCEHGHGPTEFCSRCRIPLCRHCFQLLAARQPVPMALAKDNFWGYTADIIYRYRVR